jgi:hypothetical protein
VARTSVGKIAHNALDRAAPLIQHQDACALERSEAARLASFDHAVVIRARLLKIFERIA